MPTYPFPHFVTLALTCFAALAAPAWSVEYPPQDHGGGDLVLHDGDVIWGLHYGIERFYIAPGAEVRVLPYQPTNFNSGFVDIRAQEIGIFGHLNAFGSGYTGGGGGAGADPPNTRGQGTYPGFAGGAVGQQSTPCVSSNGTFGIDVARFHGGGHSGDGPSGGMGGIGPIHGSTTCDGGGSWTLPPEPGAPGRFGTGPAMNNDTSVDNSIRMGSGGGGGSASGVDPFPGGPGGGCGGGGIRLIPLRRMILGAGALLDADGAWGSANVGSVGGNAFPPQRLNPEPDPQRRGGAGSGGGISLELRSITDFDDFIVEDGAKITCATYTDPDSAPTTGGTVKIMRLLTFNNALSRLTIISGRTYLSPPEESGTGAGWELYE